MPKYSISGSGAITISESAADNLIARKDGAAALIYLYLLRTGGDVSADDIAGALGLSIGDARTGLYALTTMGLISEAPDRHSADSFTPEVLARAMKNEEFAFIAHEVENIFAVEFGGEELKRLYNIYHNLGLPAEVILHMSQFFKNEVRRKYGPGRRLSMPALEKMAFEWKRLGIVTLEEAESYIRRSEQRSSMEGEIKRALNLSGRRFSAGERVFIDSWLDMGFGPDAFAIAAERTLNRVHSLNFKYMDKIFLSWHNKGLHTAQEIEKGDPYDTARRAPAQAENADRPAPGPTAEDFESVRRFIESMKED